jgi:MEMO1 family protein
MATRRRFLPRGWYPDDSEALRLLVSSWTEGAPQGGAPDGRALAAVAPHAGWAYSGRLAALAVASLSPLASGSTVAVFGGHLPPGARPLAAAEAAFDTPLGPVQADGELLSALASLLGAKAGPSSSAAFMADEAGDNTVEVLLPLVAALLPGSSVLWLRSPNDASSLELGEALHAAASSLGRRVACLGSTDLTHYGPNYGFSPKGRGKEAEAWVREVNDRRFIEALIALDGEEALERARAELSACSSGAAASALAFALAAGATRARLLEYATSLDVRRDESFVGYAALGFYE